MEHSNQNQEQFNQYDRNLTPSEVSAREEREAQGFKDLPEDKGDVETSGGFTVDREGKLNNFAVEPEMYVDEPGDLEQQKQANRQRRQEEREEINRPGGKGPGIV